MSDPAFGPENCTTELVIDAHRGRSTAELPAFARGMLAAAAAGAVYLTVVFAVAALFAFLAPEFFVYGEVIGGCVGGFAATFVYNFITKVSSTVDPIQSAVACIAGAILNVSLGTVKTELVSTLRGWLESPRVVTAIEEGATRAGSAAAGETSAEIIGSARTLSLEVESLNPPPVP